MTYISEEAKEQLDQISMLCISLTAYADECFRSDDLFKLSFEALNIAAKISARIQFIKLHIEREVEHESRNDGS